MPVTFWCVEKENNLKYKIYYFAAAIYNKNSNIFPYLSWSGALGNILFSICFLLLEGGHIKSLWKAKPDSAQLNLDRLQLAYPMATFHTSLSIYLIQYVATIIYYSCLINITKLWHVHWALPYLKGLNFLQFVSFLFSLTKAEP